MLLVVTASAVADGCGVGGGIVCAVATRPPPPPPPPHTHTRTHFGRRGDNDGRGVPRLTLAPSVLYGFSYAAYRVVMDGVALLLCQASFGTRALRRAGGLAALWGITIWVGFAEAWHAGHIHEFFLALNVALLGLYGALLVAPAAMLCVPLRGARLLSPFLVSAP